MLASVYLADWKREPDRRSSAGAVRQCFPDIVNRERDGGESIVVQQHKKPIVMAAENLPLGIERG
jgi:hypothetical protein